MATKLSVNVPGTLKWTKDYATMKLQAEIAKRASSMAALLGINYPILDATMDIDACHSNACELNLQQLLEADNTNFAHDVFGIRRHLNRRTGQLMDCFHPRYAA